MYLIIINYQNSCYAVITSQDAKVADAQYKIRANRDKIMNKVKGATIMILNPRTDLG